MKRESALSHRAITVEAGDRLDFGHGDQVEIAALGSRRTKLELHGSWGGVSEWIHADQTLKVQHLVSLRLVQSDGLSATLEVAAARTFRRLPPADPSSYPRHRRTRNNDGRGSLTFCRRVGETVRIGPDVTVIVTEIRRGEVRLTFKAPRAVVIDRGETPTRSGA